jgi:hypothetical protein
LPNHPGDTAHYAIREQPTQSSFAKTASSTSLHLKHDP